jgi:hypothetical protein
MHDKTYIKFCYNTLYNNTIMYHIAKWDGRSISRYESGSILL